MNDKIVTIILLVIAGLSPAMARNLIIGFTTDLNKEMASDGYTLARTALELLPVGKTIKVVSATETPDLFLELTKEKYANDKKRNEAYERYDNKLKKFIIEALRANEGNEAQGSIDAPRLIRKMRDFADGEECTLVIFGSDLWTVDAEHSFVDESQTDENLKFRRPTHGAVVADKFTSPFSMQKVPKMPHVRIIYLNPIRQPLCDDEAYSHSVEEFWAVMADQAKIRMAPMQTEVSEVLPMLFAENWDTVSPSFNSLEQGTRMLTIAEMKPRQTFTPKALPQFSVMHLIDTSGSQSKHLETIARRMIEQRGDSSGYHGLLIFDGPAPYLYSEHRDLGEIAKAFRQSPRHRGVDQSNSLSAGLKLAQDEIRARGAKNVTLRIVADVKPKEKKLPPELSYRVLMQRLMADGHNLVWVRTDPRLKATGFLPDGVKVEDL